MIAEISFTCRHGSILFSSTPATEVRMRITEENHREVLALIERAIRLDVERARRLTEAEAAP